MAVTLPVRTLNVGTSATAPLLVKMTITSNPKVRKSGAVGRWLEMIVD